LEGDEIEGYQDMHGDEDTSSNAGLYIMITTSLSTSHTTLHHLCFTFFSHTNTDPHCPPPTFRPLSPSIFFCLTHPAILYCFYLNSTAPESEKKILPNLWCDNEVTGRKGWMMGMLVFQPFSGLELSF
jgi:hypothetical protein